MEALTLDYNVGNAFDILEKDTKTYKCIYLDPPYASGRDYKFAEKDETAAFTDKLTPEKYKEWLTKLISLCKKRMSKDGTLWFHIAAEYSFIPEQVLQSEFKEVEKNFWKKSHGKNTVKNKMGAVIDIIFRCYNSTPIFNLQYVPLDAYYFENSYRNKDEKGLYALGSLRFDKTRSGNNYEITNDGITYKAPYGWKIRKEEMERLISEKRIHFVPPNEKREGNLYKKLYKTECKGKPLSNLWDDISYITRTQQDPRTYPTQKPLKLLQRIISISTNKGDLVLDPTAGSGTTGVACKTLGRNCYLIDINTDAKKIFEKRLTDVKVEEEVIKKATGLDGSETFGPPTHTQSAEKNCKKNRRIKHRYTVETMEALISAIKKERPHLSDSSIKTYTTVLKSRFKDIWPGKEFDHALYITEQEKAMNHMQSIKFNIRKTILSALVSFTTGAVQTKYRNQMMEDSQKYTALQHQHIKTEEQKENWMSWKEIEEHLAKLKNQYYYVFKEEKPTREEIMNLQSYVILACYVLMPPRRAMDYCKMKVRNYDKTKDNFYEGGKFVFSQYKTAKFMGLQIQKVPRALDLLLKKWIAFHDMDYLFANSDDKEIAGSGMTKILNTIFKPKLISVNMLRHIYITEKSAPLIDKLKETADAMAHSTGMQGLYVKKD